MEERKFMKRQTAYKIWVNDVHSSEKVVDPETSLTYLKLKDEKVVRVSLFGTIVDMKQMDSYSTLVLDDSSGAIRLRAWADDVSLFENLSLGSMVFVIGRWAEFNDERYVRPEIVREVTMDWALLRRLELTKKFGTPSKEEKVMAKVEATPVKEIEPSLAARETVMGIIEKHDEISAEDLLQESGIEKDKLDVAVMDLLKEGEIFSPKKGYYRLV